MIFLYAYGIFCLATAITSIFTCYLPVIAFCSKAKVRLRGGNIWNLIFFFIGIMFLAPLTIFKVIKGYTLVEKMVFVGGLAEKGLLVRIED